MNPASYGIDENDIIDKDLAFQMWLTLGGGDSSFNVWTNVSVRRYIN